MTILKHGFTRNEKVTSDKRYYFKCATCGCEWLTNNDDTMFIVLNGDSVLIEDPITHKIYNTSYHMRMECPDCQTFTSGYEVYHNEPDFDGSNVDPYVRACMEAEEAATYINASVNLEVDTNDHYNTMGTEQAATYINSSASAYHTYYNNIPISTNTDL